ncbi:hypothetical protein IV203_017990 [Nitzschia inconspicua]|uniref:Uncharacterized protein n=1 Tax=Nitzschia inconspicua TaxID=303405 RepID=A0A9K3Q5H1_9STRA|nr:hypothetical protein IV203_017990 [Nitzschia inconspicua]
MAFSNSQRLSFAVAAVFFAFLALICGVYGVFTCNALQFEQENGDGAISVGLFGYRTKAYTVVSDEIWVSNVCVKYNELNDFGYTTDKMTESLQALSISLAVIGTVFTILSCFVPCLPTVHPLAWKGLGLIFLVCCILQGCSLLMLQSSICLDNPVIQYLTATGNNGILNTLQDPEQCGRASGFKMSISAVVFWFVAGVIPLIVPAPCDSDESAEPSQPEAAEKDKPEQSED